MPEGKTSFYTFHNSNEQNNEENNKTKNDSAQKNTTTSKMTY